MGDLYDPSSRVNQLSKQGTSHVSQNQNSKHRNLEHLPIWQLFGFDNVRYQSCSTFHRVIYIPFLFTGHGIVVINWLHNVVYHCIPMPGIPGHLWRVSAQVLFPSYLCVYNVSLSGPHWMPPTKDAQLWDFITLPFPSELSWGLWKNFRLHLKHYETTVESRGPNAVDICDIPVSLKIHQDPLGGRCQVSNIAFSDCFPSCEGFGCQSPKVLCSHCISSVSSRHTSSPLQN